MDFLPAEPQGNPKNTGVGSLSLLQKIFPTQESNRGLLHCKWILYQLSYEESPTSWRSAQLYILCWFPLSFPKVTYGHLYQWLDTGERELLRHFNNPYRSELTVIAGDVKSKVFPVGMKIPRGQVTNREGHAMVANWTQWVHGVFPDPEHIVGTGLLGSWSNRHIRFLGCELKFSEWGWPSGNPFSRAIIAKRKISHPGHKVEISATIKK